MFICDEICSSCAIKTPITGIPSKRRIELVTRRLMHMNLVLKKLHWRNPKRFWWSLKDIMRLHHCTKDVYWQKGEIQHCSVFFGDVMSISTIVSVGFEPEEINETYLPESKSPAEFKLFKICDLWFKRRHKCGRKPSLKDVRDLSLEISAEKLSADGILKIVWRFVIHVV